MASASDTNQIIDKASASADDSPMNLSNAPNDSFATFALPPAVAKEASLPSATRLFTPNTNLNTNLTANAQNKIEIINAAVPRIHSDNAKSPTNKQSNLIQQDDLPNVGRAMRFNSAPVVHNDQTRVINENQMQSIAEKAESDNNTVPPKTPPRKNSEVDSASAYYRAVLQRQSAVPTGSQSTPGSRAESPQPIVHTPELIAVTAPSSRPVSPDLHSQSPLIASSPFIFTAPLSPDTNSSSSNTPDVRSRCVNTSYSNNTSPQNISLGATAPVPSSHRNLSHQSKPSASRTLFTDKLPAANETAHSPSDLAVNINEAEEANQVTTPDNKSTTQRTSVSFKIDPNTCNEKDVNGDVLRYTESPRFHRVIAFKTDKDQDKEKAKEKPIQVPLLSPQRKSWFSSIFARRPSMDQAKASMPSAGVAIRKHSATLTKTNHHDKQSISALYSQRSALTLANDIRSVLKATRVKFIVKKGYLFECEFNPALLEQTGRASPLTLASANRNNITQALAAPPRRRSLSSVDENIPNNTNNPKNTTSILEKTNKATRSGALHGSIVSSVRTIRTNSNADDRNNSNEPISFPANLLAANKAEADTPLSPNNNNNNSNNIAAAVALPPAPSPTHQRGGSNGGGLNILGKLGNLFAPLTSAMSDKSPFTPFTPKGGYASPTHSPVNPMSWAAAAAQQQATGGGGGGVSINTNIHTNSNVTALANLPPVRLTVEILQTQSADSRLVRFNHKSGDVLASLKLQQLIKSKLHAEEQTNLKTNTNSNTNTLPSPLNANNNNTNTVHSATCTQLSSSS